MCSSRSVTLSLVHRIQSLLQEGCIDFYRSSTLSYNERCSEQKNNVKYSYNITDLVFIYIFISLFIDREQTIV